VHYARGDARTPAVATASGWVAVVALDVALVVALPRDWTAAALGLGTTVGMTLSAVWLLVTLWRVEPDAVRGMGPSTAAATVAGAVAAGVAWLVAAALPSAGAALSVASTAVVAGCCLAVFAALASRLDPTTTQLLRRRLRRAG